MKKLIQSTISVILLLVFTATVSAQTGGLSVGSGTSFTLGPGCTLTLPGALSNSGTFTIACNATEEGSLILGDAVSGSGTFIRQQYIANDNGWHMIASPSQQDTIVGSDFVPSPTSGVLPSNFDFYSFDQSQANCWINIRASDQSVNSSFENDFTRGKGYLVAYSDTYGKTTLEFKGPFNSGDVTAPALTYTSGASWAGWNMIGNPYTSTIDWGLADHSVFTDNFAYVYDPNKAGGAGYIDVDGSTTGAYLAPGQAFFVNVATSGNFTFSPSMQLHQTSTILKSTQATQSSNKVVLQLSSDYHYNETTVRVIEGTKSARDRDDALELPSFDDSVPQLYSYTSDSVAVAINTYPALDSIHSVQLGTIIPSDGSYTISLQNRTGNFTSKPAILEDLSKGTTTDLTQESYKFDGKKTDTKRFILIFEKTNGVRQINAGSKLLVYAYNNSIHIQSRTANLLNGEVIVYNIMGEAVYRSKLNNTRQQVLYTTLPTGIYIVQLEMQDGSTMVTKVAIENF